ncbi:MAG: holo-[acyl-carrier-protein] synthase [Armatimonadetes bacterium]|nr:holo-[acyl-carrier-protein] synthase [Armatimonadota bacterium]
MILGIGVDMVDVDRIKSAIERRGEQFVARAFTEAEAEYCWRSQCPERRFAARFAAKEAVMKALGRGWFQGMPFKEIQVVRDETPEGYGRPGIRLEGKTAELAEGLGVTSINLSITHEQRAAIAFVVIEGGR